MKEYKPIAVTNNSKIPIPQDPESLKGIRTSYSKDNGNDPHRDKRSPIRSTERFLVNSALDISGELGSREISL
jgi:hypothetical protein